MNPRRVLTKPSKPAHNDGFDNEDSDYILYVNDVLGPEDKDRYLILDVLGQGTFGQVVKCQNMKTHEIVAVKVVKNKPAYFQQSMMEVTILELVSVVLLPACRWIEKPMTNSPRSSDQQPMGQGRRAPHAETEGHLHPPLASVSRV